MYVLEWVPSSNWNKHSWSERVIALGSEVGATVRGSQNMHDVYLLEASIVSKSKQILRCSFLPRKKKNKK